MKHSFLSAFILVACIAFFSCEKKDAPLLTGDLNGTVALVDGYGYPLQDKSGVQVQLSGNSFFDETTTDSIGHYTFRDVPFGSYNVNLVKENYVEHNLEYRVGHVGGDASTLTGQTMNEIPGYRYSIDSMKYNGSSRLYIYLTILEADRTFNYLTVYLHCFFSRSPDVSCENYENNILDLLVFNQETGDKTYLNYIFYGGYYQFLHDYTGTVYCRIYPQTNVDQMWYPNDSGPHLCFPETLGKPSDVFSFTVDGITSEF
jgi:hypothetical protein